MTDRQRIFADLVVLGKKSPGRCYEEAGYSQTGDNADKSASRLMANNDEVKAYIKNLRKESTSDTIMSIEKRKEMLSRMAKNEEKDRPKDARGAVDLLNRMDGAYAAEKHEHKVTSVKDIIAKARSSNGS